MKSKEIKTKIEINIGGEHLSLDIPFSRQNFVREVEAELSFRLKKLKEKHPNKGQKEHLVMLAYHFAVSYFSLKGQHEEELAEAENLLTMASRLCGDEESYSEFAPLDEAEYDESDEY